MINYNHTVWLTTQLDRVQARGIYIPQPLFPTVVQAIQRCTHNDCPGMLVQAHWQHQPLSLEISLNLHKHVTSERCLGELLLERKEN